MRQFFLSFLLFTIYYLLFTFQPAFAAGEFSSSYRINYDVTESGITNVTYKINITNLTTQYYVSEYELTVPSEKIEGTLAADRLGKINPTVEKNEGSTKIHLVFNERVVGKGNILYFGLSYKNPEMAQKNGRIWEINLPPKADNPEIVEYNVRLEVPESFGQPAYIFPQPENSFFWTKDELSGGVTAAFGDYQLFNFGLKYHLSNTQLFPFYTEIALPSDNAYQRVRFEKIEPKPVSVRQDEDGNWLARYDLSPGEKFEIQVFGLVKITPFPDLDFPQKEGKLTKYLSEQKYWETTDEDIKKLAQELKTPEAIYDYVVKTLKYDYQKAKEGGSRSGAKGALKAPDKSICMEFTDLFIALVRAAGIPAREVDGFAYTTNSKLRPLSLEKDILHAWPEYWDSKRQAWVMVDPTWGKTTGGLDYFQKLDFNHFALAIKGISSESPAPAGAYKLGGQEGKDVGVKFAQGDWQETNPQYEVVWSLPQWAISGLRFVGSVTIKNTGQTAIYGKKAQISSAPSGILQNETFELNLAPQESYKHSLTPKGSSFFASFRGPLSLTIEGENFSTPFEIKPLGWMVLGAVAALGLVLAITVAFVKLWPRFKIRPIQQNEPPPAS